MKILLTSFIVPVLLFGLDQDLEEMNVQDNQVTQALSPLFTVRSGYAYSEWKMPSMNSFSQETQGLNLAWIDLIYKGNMANVDGNRNYLHYERSFNKDWDEKIILQEDVIKNSDNYELIKGKITLPFSHYYGGQEKTFFLKGSMERYLSRISSKTNTAFVDRTGNSNFLAQGDSLVFETKFNEIAFGINQYDGLDTFLFFGDYQKPYTVLKNGVEVENFNEYLFYSKIKTYGLGIDFNVGQEKFYFNPLFKFGWADIELTDNLNLTDLDFKKSTYFQFKLKTGYAFQPIDVIKNFNINIQGIYDIRYFNEPDSDGKTTMFSSKNSTNKDDIMKAFVSLQYSF